MCKIYANKMQAILVIKVYDFPGLMKSIGTVSATYAVYELRSAAKFYMSGNVFNSFNDSIYAVFPTPAEAISAATRVIRRLSPDVINSTSTPNISNTGIESIPLCGSIGFGELYQTADGNYWGPEINRAVSLSENAKYKEILLTDSAKNRISPINREKCK